MLNLTKLNLSIINIAYLFVSLLGGRPVRPVKPVVRPPRGKKNVEQCSLCGLHEHYSLALSGADILGMQRGFQHILFNFTFYYYLLN